MSLLYAMLIVYFNNHASTILSAPTMASMYTNVNLMIIWLITYDCCGVGVCVGEVVSPFLTAPRIDFTDVTLFVLAVVVCLAIDYAGSGPTISTCHVCDYDITGWHQHCFLCANWCHWACTMNYHNHRICRRCLLYENVPVF